MTQDDWTHEFIESSTLDNSTFLTKKFVVLAAVAFTAYVVTLHLMAKTRLDV